MYILYATTLWTVFLISPSGPDVFFARILFYTNNLCTLRVFDINEFNSDSINNMSLAQPRLAHARSVTQIAGLTYNFRHLLQIFFMVLQNLYAFTTAIFFDEYFLVYTI